MNYEIRYGHSENSEKEYVNTYEEAIKRMDDLKGLQLNCKNSKILFPINYIRIINLNTCFEIVWRSKESMEFTGVL